DYYCGSWDNSINHVF
nr:immunoglobulin light chain junction region [Macaca mulatta]MOW60654.1 immunoglobulin light chain junction region [Macaca mulatta]